MTESEWQLFRRIRVVALDRFCQRVLSEIKDVAADTSKSNHERYLAVFRLLGDRDDELARAFNGASRSSALIQLMCMQSLRLLTDEELAQFSDQTRESVLSSTGSRD